MCAAHTGLFFLAPIDWLSLPTKKQESIPLQTIFLQYRVPGVFLSFRNQHQQEIMMKQKWIYAVLISCLFSITTNSSAKDNFQYETERFADLKILRYVVPGFDKLELKKKQLLYYLYQAGLSGRDIFYDQNYKHNLTIRRTLEQIVQHYTGDKTSDDFKRFMTYAKRVWFSNGIHHHYSNDKIMPDFSPEQFEHYVYNSGQATFPLHDGEYLHDFIKRLKPIIFNPNIDGKKVNKTPNIDSVVNSATNYYEGVTEKEVDEFYKKLADSAGKYPPMFGLNSKLIKENGLVKEKVWKVGGMYSEAIEKIVFWLKKATTVAENDKQKAALEILIQYYQTGDLTVFDKFNIAWLKDTDSDIDLINGFIEVYADPKGYRGAFESVLQLKDPVGTKRIGKIAEEAQWFEKHSPIADEYKRDEVKGIIGRAIYVVNEVGDSSPSTPIGINLPNSNWIRSKHGSKSIFITNVVDAYDKSKGGTTKEFALTEEELERAKKYGPIAGHLHTDMHEVIGHASGKLSPGVLSPHQTLKHYALALEEARADLVALYYLMDQKLIDLGLMPNFEVGKAKYDAYILNGLMLQLFRIKLGEKIEQAHMRNRATISRWVYEHGKADNVIEKVIKDGKTYFVVRDYQKLRQLFAVLLKEIQRIKSEGDFEAGKALIETYGVKIDYALHKEVLERFKKLNNVPYSGFINPLLIPEYSGDQIIDVKIVYPKNFTEQMMYYAKHYSFLPHYN